MTAAFDYQRLAARLSAPVKELKKSLAQHQKDQNADAFVVDCESVVDKYTQAQSGPEGDADAPGRPLIRGDLRLICFDFLS